MAEITKSKSQTTVIENYLFFFGRWTYQGRRTLVEGSSCRAIFSRPKPADLSPTHMFVNRVKYNTSQYSTALRRGYIDYVHAGLPSRTRTVSTATGGRTEQIAVTDAQARLARGSLNAAQTLAESRETFGTIFTNVYRLGRFALELKRGNFKAAAQVLDIQLSRRGHARLKKQSMLDRMSNGWLEYSYGIQPIISDIEGAIQFADDRFHEGASRTSFGGTSRKQAELTSDLSEVEKWGASSTIELAPRITYRGAISNPNLRRAQELGFLNPLALWWELVPLSFVFDWFGTIGAWFDSLTHGAGLRYVWGCRTSYNARITYLQGAGFVQRTETITRAPVLPSTSSSPFLLRNSPLNGKQITSLAALYKQRL